MNIDEYDLLLSTLRTPDDWGRVPQGDFILYSCFGSIAPRIALRSHRLIESNKSVFSGLLSLLGAEAAILGEIPQSIWARMPDNGIDVTSENAFPSWAERENQKELVAEIENLKYVTPINLICDARLPKNTVSLLFDSPVYAIRTGHVTGRVETRAWFDAIDTFLDKCGWFYIPLPEITNYDLFVFIGDGNGALPRALDANYPTAQITWRDGRAHWPTE